jgi:hypothetical protein
VQNENFTLAEYTEAASPSTAYTAALTAVQPKNPWQRLDEYYASNPDASNPDDSASNAKANTRMDEDQPCQPTSCVNREGGDSTGNSSVLESSSDSELDPENTISNEQTALDSADQRRLPLQKGKLRHVENLEGWKADPTKTFIPADPIEIAQHMLSKVSERYPQPYQPYITQHHLEKEPQEELCPAAWNVFQSKDYTRQR